MLKSRIQKLEEKASRRLGGEKVLVIGIHKSLVGAFYRRDPEDKLPINLPGETKEEFEIRLRKEGKNMGIWVMDEGQ